MVLENVNCPSLGNTRKSNKQGKKNWQVRNGFKMYHTSMKLNTMWPLNIFQRTLKKLGNNRMYKMNSFFKNTYI